METISKAFNGRLIACQDLPPRATIFGQSEGLKGLSRIVEKIASASVPILILGESGTGKEVLAHFIHSLSPGSFAPFFKVSPRNVDGHAIDGVTFRVDPEGQGRDGNHACKVDALRRTCTLFVDEVAELGSQNQLELLQLIQGFRSYISSAGTDIPVTLRVIGTSTHDLEHDVVVGNFRDDLFSFLSVVTLKLPPLRERKEDIPLLANHFWRVYSQQFGRQPEAPSSRLIANLQEHDWPGNIRELENVMKRYVVLGTEGIEERGDSVTGEGDAALRSPVRHPFSLKDVTREASHALERKIILRTLQETQWNRRRTARALNISYRALLYKIKEGGLLSEQAKANAGGSDQRTLKSSREAA